MRVQQMNGFSKTAVLLCLTALVAVRAGYAEPAKPGSSVDPMSIVLGLNLPHHDGVAPLYYSACCRERAFEIQKTLQDMGVFYKEKLGLDVPISIAVLDETDWKRVAERMPNHIFQPYGMTNFRVTPSGSVAFVPADDKGVITQSQLADRPYATTAALKSFASAHLTYDEAARDFIFHPALHEFGHVLIHAYGIDPPDHWVTEMLASYFAYAYEKMRDPQIATLVEGFTQMSSPPVRFRSLEEFENAFVQKKNMSSANYAWYEHQFERRVIEVYCQQGLSFLIKMKAAFPVPAGGERRYQWLTVPQTLSRMERVCPGFQTWAKRAFSPVRAEQAKVQAQHTTAKNGTSDNFMSPSLPVLRSLNLPSIAA